MDQINTQARQPDSTISNDQPTEPQQLQSTNELWKKAKQLVGNCKPRIYLLSGAILLLVLGDYIVALLVQKTENIIILSSVGIFVRFIVPLIFAYLMLKIFELYRRNIPSSAERPPLPFWKKFLHYIYLAIVYGFMITGSWGIFIILAIFYLIWFSMSNYFFYYQDVTGLGALINSKKLIKGRGWQVFARLLRPILLSVLFGLLYSFWSFPQIEPNLFGSYSVIFTIISVTAGGFFFLYLYPIILAYNSMLFFNLLAVRGYQPIYSFSIKTKLKQIILPTIGWIMGVILIIAIPTAMLWFVASKTSTGGLEEWKQSPFFDNADLNKIGIEIAGYRLEHEVYPNSLDDLLIEADLRQRFDQKYIYKKPSDAYGSYDICLKENPEECRSEYLNKLYSQ